MTIGYVTVSLISFTIGFIFGNFTNKFLRNFMYKNKVYGIDEEDGIRTFLIVCVALVWIVANALAFYDGRPVDITLHAIFGTIIGAYFGSKMIRNGK